MALDSSGEIVSTNFPPLQVVLALSDYSTRHGISLIAAEVL
jgi:hypothetical protein